MAFFWAFDYVAISSAPLCPTIRLLQRGNVTPFRGRGRPVTSTGRSDPDPDPEAGGRWPVHNSRWLSTADSHIAPCVQSR